MDVRRRTPLGGVAGLKSLENGNFGYARCSVGVGEARRDEAGHGAATPGGRSTRGRRWPLVRHGDETSRRRCGG